MKKMIILGEPWATALFEKRLKKICLEEQAA
jgi:hypothetical protein